MTKQSNCRDFLCPLVYLLKLLLNPNWFFSVTRWASKSGDKFLGTRNSNFIQKASRLRRWQTHVSKNHLTPVKIYYFSKSSPNCIFMLKREVSCHWQSSWCRNPVFLPVSLWVRPRCSCESPRCSCESPTKQMSFSVLQLFTHICIKARALRMGYPVYFRF